MMRVAVLGSTGSIGVSTLDVLGRHPDRFEVTALAAASSHARLLEQCLRFRPRFAVLQESQAAAELVSAIRNAGLSTEVLTGAAALRDVAEHLTGLQIDYYVLVDMKAFVELVEAVGGGDGYVGRDGGRAGGNTDRDTDRWSVRRVLYRGA